MDQKGKTLIYGKQANRPMSVTYWPELDVSQVLNPKEAQEYQQFVGIARWIIELGRFDIFFEVSLLSSHLAMPRNERMDALMGIFAYLDKSFGKTIIIDPIIPKVDTSMEIKTNWLKSIYGEDLQEEICPMLKIGRRKTCFVLTLT